MKYANLNWILGFGGIQQYRLAAALNMSEAMLCRKMAGRADFLPHEKERAAAFLGYASSFLFAEMQPPVSARIHPAMQATA